MKKIHKISVLLLACAMAISLCACGQGGNNASQTTSYTIQYTDDTGVHSFRVQSGKLYSIETIPQKNGYDFMGLFDAEVGGTQYVNAGGSSVAAFTDNQNIVLYPQFKAKEYTLVLDYQGAAVTGSRSLTVGYNSLINDLPMNLTMENKYFTGWYTQPDRGGTQVADTYGVIPAKNLIDESIFDLSDPKGYIYLYAGFKGEEFTVTFYLSDSGTPEEVQVEYGTPISQVQLETRVDGKAVIAWSKKKNDTAKEEVFNGKVTSEMVLYAAEYAPVIDFESNGGNAINSIIARAGDAVKLPTPVRENYKFIGWQDANGKIYSVTTMPTDSVKLTAKWQAMILFDTNGGTDVATISEPQGTRITLPETEKAGYMFAGWYLGDGEKYTNTAMPSASIRLYAKYWKVLKETIVVISDSEERGGWCSNSSSYPVKTYPSMDYSMTILDLSNIYNAGVRSIKISVNYDSRCSDGSASKPYSTYMSWYSQNTASDAYKLWTYSEIHKNGDYQTYSNTTKLQLGDSKLYICRYASNGGCSYYWTDFYVEIEYPDMSTLY